jgi:hypothetical protein
MNLVAVPRRGMSLLIICPARKVRSDSSRIAGLLLFSGSMREPFRGNLSLFEAEREKSRFSAASARCGSSWLNHSLLASEKPNRSCSRVSSKVALTDQVLKDEKVFPLVAHASSRDSGTDVQPAGEADNGFGGSVLGQTRRFPELGRDQRLLGKGIRLLFALLFCAPGSGGSPSSARN